MKETIYSALEVVIQRHPILSAITVDENTSHPYFARLPVINIENAVTFITRKSQTAQGWRDTELDELLQAQHNVPFKSDYGSVPFWRLIILTNPGANHEFVASFIYHHALGDGASGIAFHKHFCSALSSNAPLSSKIINSPGQPLLLNLELLHPLPLLPGHFAEVECTIPVNIRHWLPASIDNDSFGTWIDATSLYFRRAQASEFSWDEARRSREQIMAYLASEGQAINVAKFKTIPDMREFFQSRVGKERNSSFDVSNLGVVKAASEDSEWEIGRTVFSRSAWVTGSAFTVGVVTGGDGCLVLGFVWQEGVVGREIVDGVVEMVERQVDILVLET
jgi:hypothetical protein